MGASDFIPYREQVINFLETCTIHFPPFAQVINKKLMEDGYVVDPNRPASWKYYKNLVGEYHEADELMEVISLDTQEPVSFTKENLVLHKKTHKAYRVGSPLYEELCEKYPLQVDLIKNILHPVPSMLEAMKSDYFVLLKYGDGYLEKEEQPYILSEVRKFLEYIKGRWFIEFVSYEDHFYNVFWIMTWDLLYSAIMTARVKAIHTSEVHSFHIWEYLKSKGLEDYSDILNRKSSMFLYRNIAYLLANRGKQSNLIILADNLLIDLYVALIGRVAYQQTENGREECRWVPEYLAEPVPTVYAGSISDVIPSQSTDDIIQRVYDINLDDFPSDVYVDRMERKVGYTDLNTLYTKFLELQPLPMDRKYNDVLNNFVIDTVTQMVNDNRYDPKIDYTDENTGVRLKINGKQALALIYWLVNTAYENEPTHLPSVYTPKASYKYDVDRTLIPSRYTYDGHWYPMSGLCDVDSFLRGVYIPSGVINETGDMSNLVGDLFGVMVKQLTMMRFPADHVVALGYRDMFLRVTNNKIYNISFSDATVYEDFFLHPDNEDINQLVNILRTSTQKKKYCNELSDKLLELLVPKTDSIMQYLADIHTDNFYKRLKKLFVQMCSYNVLFLDKERSVETWIFLSKLTWYRKRILSSATLELDITLDIEGWNKTFFDLDLDPGLEFSEEARRIYQELWFRLDFDYQYKNTITEVISYEENTLPEVIHRKTYAELHVPATSSSVGIDHL